MSHSIITPEVIDKVLQHLEMETEFKSNCVSYEIQDDNNHLLISISIDELPEHVSSLAFKRVGDLVNLLVPGRKGDYSWMVVFVKDGRVVDSYFGGNLDSPRSGL